MTEKRQGITRGVRPIEVSVNPLGPDIHLQILQTDLHTFP